MKLIEADKPEENENYYLYIHNVWSSLLNMQLTAHPKYKIRRDQLNHFGFMLNRTFLFNKNKITTDQGLILLLKLVGSFLKIAWVKYILLITLIFLIILTSVLDLFYRLIQLC